MQEMQGLQIRQVDMTLEDHWFVAAAPSLTGKMCVWGGNNSVLWDVSPNETAWLFYVIK